MKWTLEEILWLKQNYPQKNIEFCSNILHRSLASIKNKANHLQLKRSIWNENTITWLQNNYPYNGKRFCSKFLGVSEASIKMEVLRLGLNRIFPDLKTRKELINKRRKKWYSLPQNRIAMICRVRIREALKGKKKLLNTEILLGCSFNNFKKYLESKFLPNMSWNNYGQWHIDHKLPCSSFNLSDLKKQKECFHYTNLQPLWAKDNLKKGFKIV